MLPVYSIEHLTAHKKPRWIIKDTIPDNSSIIMFGQPGCGKTFIALDIALHVANDMNWQGQTLEKQGAVVYMVAEGLYGIGKRCEAWHTYHNIGITQQFYTVPFHTVTLWKDETIQELKKTLDTIAKTCRISLIIIDTLSRAMSGLEENSSKDAMVFLQQMEHIKDTFQCSMMFVHHGGKDVTRGMRGSSALLAGVDTCVMIGNASNQIKWMTQKQKDGECVHLNFNLLKYNDSMIVVPHETIQHDVKDNQHTYANHGKPWTKEQEDWMLKAIQKGLTHIQISARMERTKGGILSRLRHMVRERNWTIEEAVEKTNLTKEQVEDALARGIKKQ